MITTRLGQVGVGAGAYPGFLPKGLGHNPGVITRLGQCGVGATRYSAFLPKQSAIDIPIVPVVVPPYSGGGVGDFEKYFDARMKRYDIPIALDTEIEEEEIIMTILLGVAHVFS